MVNLNSHSVYTSFNPGAVGTTFQQGTNYSIQIPNSTVMMAKPVSYEFRVVEHVKNGEVVKVGLQYQVWEHDNYGTGNVKQTWTDVVRVQKDVDTGEIIGI